MRIIKNVLSVILVITALITVCPVQKVVYAQSYGGEILIEQSTRRVLYEYNSEKIAPMASTTKILTAITVIENADLSAVVCIDGRMTGIEGSSVYLKEGEKYTVEDLLYGLMLRSGNDCAVALALTVGESIEGFCRLMNEVSEKAGAKNSNFVNPHGLPDDRHYTTACDLALISAYASDNEVFSGIVSSKSHKITELVSGTERTLVNKNKMLGCYDGADGIKTGFTKKAGRCLVSSATRKGMKLISVVLNCGEMWERSVELLDYGFENYELVKVFDSELIIDNLNVAKSNKKCAVKCKKDVYLPLKDGEKGKVEVVYDYPEILVKPVKSGDIIGEIRFYIKNRLIFSQKIYTISNVI